MPNLLDIFRNLGYFCAMTGLCRRICWMQSPFGPAEAARAHVEDRHRQDTINWINGTGKASTAFDFTTKGAMAKPNTSMPFLPTWVESRRHNSQVCWCVSTPLYHSLPPKSVGEEADFASTPPRSKSPEPVVGNPIPSKTFCAELARNHNSPHDRRASFIEV